MTWTSIKVTLYINDPGISKLRARSLSHSCAGREAWGKLTLTTLLYYIASGLYFLYWSDNQKAGSETLLVDQKLYWWIRNFTGGSETLRIHQKGDQKLYWWIRNLDQKLYWWIRNFTGGSETWIRNFTGGSETLLVDQKLYESIRHLNLAWTERPCVCMHSTDSS